MNRRAFLKSLAVGAGLAALPLPLIGKKNHATDTYKLRMSSDPVRYVVVNPKTRTWKEHKSYVEAVEAMLWAQSAGTRRRLYEPGFNPYDPPLGHPILLDYTEPIWCVKLHHVDYPQGTGRWHFTMHVIPADVVTSDQYDKLLECFYIDLDTNCTPGAPFKMAVLTTTAVALPDPTPLGVIEPQSIEHRGRSLGQFEEVKRISRLPEFLAASRNDFGELLDHYCGPFSFSYQGTDGWYYSRWILPDGTTKTLYAVHWMKTADANRLTVPCTKTDPFKKCPGCPEFKGFTQLSRFSGEGEIEIT
jgi:hypothetical protein